MTSLPALAPLLRMVGFAALSLAAVYSVLTVAAVLAWRLQRRRVRSRPMPAVTMLKPLCGAEPGLYEHLRSFCRQDYPEFQIVFGVLDPADPACAVVRRLAAEFPHLAVELVVDSRVHGSNRKISNLINMLAYARHDILVMADSDAFVAADYLATVTAPLLDRSVGLVTCIYRGAPTRSVWSRLGAMYINEWYIPSVLLAWLFGHRGYVSGQTVCLRRDTLEAMGGLPSLVNHLADDYRLGELVRGLGLRIVLSTYVPDGEHHEPDFDALTRHELRWMRTLRVLRPRSFRLLFFSFSLPLAVLGMLAVAAESAPSTAAWALFTATAAARLVLHFAHRLPDRALLPDLWLVPVRDFLICQVWCRSFFTSRVTWRGSEFDVDPDGVMRPLS
ncbi:MAG TPA: bacteriohopanetetrol glucosamine biosynthesis glycosyltransferase HpnI [Steroidobacteraceae bacterium]|nr:bacteriohopanetetrol glucosamine biosynthesis glycosyltransferase HpnI [Steroidobacteraceae bacterium]